MKRRISLILALLLITLCCSCQSQETLPTTTAGGQTPSPAAADAAPKTVAAASTNASVNAPPVFDPADSYRGLQLPLVEEPTSFEMFRTVGNAITYHNYSNYDEVPGYVAAEKATGIRIDWTNVSDFATQFPLMIASSEYPDAFICYTSMLSTGLDTYVDEEILLDLTDIILNNCPNYQYIRTMDDTISRETLNDDSRMLAFYNIKQSSQPSWLGLITQADWLQAWGGTLETFDDYYDYLKWMVETHNPEKPYAMGTNGMDMYMLSGFNVNAGWAVKDGRVQYCPVTQDFKEYIATMKKWYDEGLIHSNFYGDTTNDFTAFEPLAQGQIGITGYCYTFMPVAENYAERPGYLVGISSPVRNHGDHRLIEFSGCSASRFETGMAAIFSTCSDPVTLAKYLDYFYTPEGTMLADYGIEGESYHLDEDGKPQFVDYIVHNPDHLAPIQAWSKWTADGVPHYYDWTKEINDSLTQSGREAPGIWDANWVDAMSLSATLTRTADENAVFASIMNDVDTRVSESVVKYIIGTEPYENWDSFVDSLWGMKLQEAIDIQQAAYDRFMARGK